MRVELVAVLAAIWQDLQQHELSPARLEQFERSAAFHRFQSIPEALLRPAAMAAMERSGGRLLLRDWMAEAQRLRADQVKEERRARRVKAQKLGGIEASRAREARRQTWSEIERPPPPDEAPRLVTCPACGHGIDLYSAACACK